MELQCYESIKFSLSPDPETRRIGEDSLKNLELNPDFSQALVKIAQSNDITEDIRQLSLIILKSYVDARWNLGCEKYTEGPIASQISKDLVRNVTFQLLSDNILKIRKAAAYALSIIARYDWPDEWPNLFNQLLEQLKMGDPNQKYSSLLVFKELISRDLSTDQLLELSLLLSELKNIFITDSVCFKTLSIESKTISVQILEEGIEILSLVNHKGLNVDSFKIEPLILEWIQLLLLNIREKITDSSIDLVSLKYSSVKALHKISMTFIKIYNDLSDSIVTCVWEEIKGGYHNYESQYLCSDSYDQKQDGWAASFTLDDGSAISFSMYISMLLEYFEFIFRQKNSGKILNNNSLISSSSNDFLTELVSACIGYLQISQDTVELWTSDVNQFVLEEESASNNYTTRLASRDLILSLAKKFPSGFINSIQIILAHKLEFTDDKNTKTGFYNESLLFTLELIGDEILFVLKSGENPNLDLIIRKTISDILIPSVTTPYNIFLAARSFVLSSIYFNFLPPQSLSHMIEFAINQSQISQSNPSYFEIYSHPIVQLCSIKACTKFCSSAPKDVIKNYIPEIIFKSAKLSPSLDQDSLTIPLECILAALKLDPSVYLAVEPIVGELVLELWKIYYLDPILESLFTDILVKLSSTPESFASVFNRFSPILLSTFNEENVDRIPSAIEMITSIIKGGGAGSLAIPKECVDSVFPRLMRILLTYKDSEIAQNGQECLKYFVQNGLYQISEYKENDITGLQLLFEFIESVLSPDSNESSALFVGDLVTKIIFKNAQGNIVSGDNLARLVYLVLRKLAVARSSVLISSLLPPICLLFTRSAIQVVDLLYNISVSDSQGKDNNGLGIFLNIWTENALDIQGVYFNKVSVAAMINILVLNDSRVNAVNVNDEEEVSNAPSHKFNLRSRVKIVPIKYKQIPAPVKMIKLLIEEYSSNKQDQDNVKVSILGKKMSKNRMDESNLDENDSWDELDDDYESDDPDNPNEEFDNGGDVFTSDLIDQFGGGSGMFKKFNGSSEYSDDEDEETTKDPIYNMDTCNMIRDMFVGVNNTNPGFYSLVGPFLTKSEKSALEGILSHTA
ncbi:Importin-9 [Smittium mucronatum]|uniref:Importin-9 n=1 Tax=Smittium mucronatum TaxID=133383 RepID=A0A1R0GLS9_9FUNG|nr:Importin-9 [Smittium mucronatum]